MDSENLLMQYNTISLDFATSFKKQTISYTTHNPAFPL